MIDIELKGISMAATNGDISPRTAMLNPTILYSSDKTKLAIIIRLVEEMYSRIFAN
jgi:hypothetical protein